MKSIIVIALIAAVLALPTTSFSQQKAKDAYQPSKHAFTGKVGGTLTFKKDGGMEFKNMTCDTLYCDSVVIPLKSNKVEKNLLQTKDFGKVKVEIDPKTGGLKVSLTPEQEKKIGKFVLKSKGI